MEFGAELSDAYSDLYEYELKKAKKSAEKLNEYALKSIKNGDAFTSIVYKKEDQADKFEYVSTMLNLELNKASKLSKLIVYEDQQRINMIKESLNVYR